MANIAAAVIGTVAAVAQLYALYCALGYAYDIRLHAIREFGLVIHEFDPWFNFRATQYLADNGWYKFFHWFDYMSWYPLGRPVGTTIYPGMQITSVSIWTVLPYFGINMSLNDVCCYVPAWGGAVATFLNFLLTYECSGSANSAVAAALIMSVIPAHIMRSVGGGYDNESVAISAMSLTFLAWCWSLREGAPKWAGAVAGLAYIYMAAAWGGFVFVLNMVGLHAAGLVAMGFYSDKLHRSYSLFYVVGTLGAMQVPVIGWTPLKSVEQLGPGVVFLVMQIIKYCEDRRKEQGKSLLSAYKIYISNFAMAGAVLALVVAILWPTGYFGPLSSRVRGLFVKHTRTGNPLVDSVAEHQPASAQAFLQYLHNVYYIAPVGLAISFIRMRDASLFLVFYGLTAYFFSTKMVRLTILLGPIASALGGIAIGFCLDVMQNQLVSCLSPAPAEDIDSIEPEDKKGEKKNSKKQDDKKRSANGGESMYRLLTSKYDAVLEILEPYRKTASRVYHLPAVRVLRVLLVLAVCIALFYPKQPRAYIPKAYRKQLAKYVPKTLSLFGVQLSGYPTEFYEYSRDLAARMSNPSIMFKAKLQNGKEIIVDDYREAYFWLRDKTPADSRVMAWWDYGYQITGIGNRTTIADGNTWNHEHIATLGRTLTSSEKKAHSVIRHWADYVLIWTGGGGDDLAKSPHMARIAASVYPEHCPGDPTCRMYGFDRNRQPTPMMKKSLLYKLSKHGQQGVTANSTLFKEVFKSKYGKVRIFRVENVSMKSKRWVADPTNRLCDAPGSWYCTGQYPPPIQKLLSEVWKKKDFAQVEDWNKKREAASDKHYEDYMRRMGGGK